MATEVKRYLASDGKEFNTAEAADHHDAAVEFCRHVQPSSSQQQVYEAIVKALEKGWEITPPWAIPK